MEPEWQRPSQIMTWLQAPRQSLLEQDFALFKENNFDRELGGVSTLGSDWQNTH